MSECKTLLLHFLSLRFSELFQTLLSFPFIWPQMTRIKSIAIGPRKEKARYIDIIEITTGFFCEMKNEEISPNETLYCHVCHCHVLSLYACWTMHTMYKSQFNSILRFSYFDLFF